MKSNILILVLAFSLINIVDLLSEPATRPVFYQRTGGGGSIWNLWGEYYANVIEEHTENYDRLICSGNGRLDCSWLNPPLPPGLGLNYRYLYDEMQDYVGHEIENLNLVGSHSDAVIIQGNTYLRSVQWDGTDINNNQIIINIIDYNSLY